MKKVDLAYIAGLFDGEGCISYERKPPYGIHVIVIMGQTEEYLIRWLYLAYGGRVRVRKAPTKFPNAKPLYVWWLRANEACSFLGDILPYLRIKKPQAEASIKYQEYLNSGHWGGKGHPLTNEQIALREAHRILIASLNKKGRA